MVIDYKAIIILFFESTDYRIKYCNTYVESSFCHRQRRKSKKCFVRKNIYFDIKGRINSLVVSALNTKLPVAIPIRLQIFV